MHRIQNSIRFLPHLRNKRGISNTAPLLSSAQPEKQNDKLVIFDTTLRDGEQSPGATLTLKEKVEIARQLSRLGVDVCEAGFPIASPGDFDAVKAVAEIVGPLKHGRSEKNGYMTIAGLARAAEKDILRAYDAVRHAPKHRIHTFLATSDIHLEHKLKISRQQCIEQAVKAVKLARSLCDDVEFSTEDGGRSDPKFLVDVLSAVIEAGATTLNIPDTVGYTTPSELGQLFKYLIKNTPGSNKVIWSAHCHNDLGLATANTLEGIKNGVRQAEVTINGIGERAGNTSLEEVVMAIHTRPHHFPVSISHIDTSQIIRTSRMVSNFTGLEVQPNKAIVGANAFAHEAGIHQDGVLKHQATYEIMRPETVGWASNTLVLGKHSGKHAYRQRLNELGYNDLKPDQIEKLVDEFKKLADEKRVVTDADIEAIISDELFKPDPVWILKDVHVTAGNVLWPTATVCLKNANTEEEYTEAAIGTGPVDAVYQAINRIVRVSNNLTEFSVKSVTEGLKALGEVTIKLEPLRTQGVDSTIHAQTGTKINPTYIGHGANTDIIVASAQAYLNALNRMLVGDGLKQNENLDSTVHEVHSRPLA